MRNLQTQQKTLGLFLGGGQLAFAVVAPGKRTPRVLAKGSAPFELAPGQDAPDVMAARLREILTQHRVRTRHCVLALPLSLIVSSRFQTNGIQAADIPEMAALDLERLCGAPVPADRLVAFPADTGGQALALAVEPGVAAHLTEACRQAGLKLACFVPAGSNPLPSKAPGTAVDVLPLRREVDALVWRDGQVAALRQLALVDGSSQQLDDCVRTAVRNLHVTLVGLPEAGSPTVDVRVLGTGECAKALAEQIRRRDDWQLLTGDDQEAAQPALLAAVLAGQLRGLDGSALCLPPPARERRSAWWHKPSSRPLVAAALVAVLGILAFVGAFTVRRLEVRRLEAELAELAPRKLEGERLRDGLRLTAPWYRQTPERLAVLRAITEAFPDRGTVWGTDLTIEGDGKAALSGCARDHGSWTQALDALRTRTRELSVVRFRQGAKAGEPMTFSVVFSLPGPGSRGGA